MNSSYLDVPRIHFAGKFRADVNTRNNDPCNFDTSLPVSDGQEWNFNGTSEWEFIDTRVTSVIDCNGYNDPKSSLIGAEFFSNQEQPLAKIVDLDVDFQLSSLYGLKVGLKVNGQTLFLGDWSPSVAVRDMWNKMKCTTNEDVHRDAMYGASSTSRITNIKWFPSNLSPDLQIAANSGNGDLFVAISYNYYNQKAFTVGDITGTIGVANDGEPLNAGGSRKLETTKPKLTFSQGHKCADFRVKEPHSWTHIAPFIVDKSRSKLVIDISSAFPVDINNEPVDLGVLWFGVLEHDESVSIFGDQIPYKKMETFKTYSGILEYDLTGDIIEKLEDSLLVIVKEVSESGNESPTDSFLPVKETFLSLQATPHKVQLLLKELLYYVRPMDYYMDRLEYQSTRNMTLLVSQFGKPAAKGVTVRVHNAVQVIPEEGVVADKGVAQTDDSGQAKFTFEVQHRIPKRRKYYVEEGSQKCPPVTVQWQKFDHPKNVHNVKVETKKQLRISELPIDGQVYHFYYCVDEDINNQCNIPDDFGGLQLFFSPNILSFLAFSTIEYKRPYTWVHDIKPIFHQVHHLHYIMRTILDLRNYTAVTLPHNIELLRMSFTKDFTDPGYMPVTRDLSPTKRNMILEWLNKPCYDNECKSLDTGVPMVPVCHSPPSPTRYIAIPSASYFIPPRCMLSAISYHDNPEKADPYFTQIFHDERSHSSKLLVSPRPLFGFESAKHRTEITKYLSKSTTINTRCSVDRLKDQLQLATELEFATLPVYLTSLYSIMEGCNPEAYQAMRDIVMQEMLHYAQAANLLISVGGKVRLDSPDTVPPRYPYKGLPGGVLPNLELSLKKFNLEHVYLTFMGIETPEDTSVIHQDPKVKLHTIGQFYREIQLCMKSLGDDIFQNSAEQLQIEWPWNEHPNIGKLYTVTNLKTANEAITQIIHQGEGASPVNPEGGTEGQYAHYYRFEEIVCQKRLVKSNDSYSFSGAPITYNPAGVWPMRENPSKEDIKPNSECHTQARAFHQVYRNFLRVLQETVDGSPDKVKEAVELMESFQVHLKKAIWTPFDEVRTCGPIWDYEWE